jgi:hypothetical protein
VNSQKYRKWRSEQIKRGRRDKEILRSLGRRLRVRREFNAAQKKPHDPLTVFIPDPGNPSASPFPISHTSIPPNAINRTASTNARHVWIRLPRWEDLSQWAKVQVALLGMGELGAITFTGNLHPDLETQWVGEGRDILAEVRDRLRRQLKSITGKRIECCFVMEGHTKGIKKETFLHIHGFICLAQLDDLGFTKCEEILKLALKRTIGEISSRPSMNRAKHTKEYYGYERTYGAYLFKRIPTPDPRLRDMRLVMSGEMTKGARMLWNMMSGRDNPEDYD